MLVGHSPSEALRWYYRAAVAGRPEAAGSLGVQLSLGRHPGAEVWLRYAADRGDARAASMLAAHLSRQGDSDEAEVERLYRQAAEGGSAPGARNLGIILERRGELDAAMKWYLQAHEAGALGTEGLIGNLLQRQGKPRESEEWLLRAADMAMTRLPDTLPLPPGRAFPTPADTVEE
jgi:TPR repeat protein